MSGASDPNRIVETLKAKAMLLIQREREVYALRLGRERMIAWLQAFHRISVGVRPEAGDAICAEWTAVMVAELHFQTAAAFRHDPGSGELALLHGKSHAPLEVRRSLGEASRRVLRDRREGVFGRTDDPDLVAFARDLGLQRFLWFVFPDRTGQEILLTAGVSGGVAAVQGAISDDDLLYFTMLGRHLAALLSNENLIVELGAASRRLQELFDHMRQAIVTFDASGSVGSVSSRQARVLFGTESLQGCCIRDLLYPGAPEYDVDAATFTDWLDLVMDAPAADWPYYEPFAPREIALDLGDGASAPVELEFRPLVRDGKIAQIMVLATDVTLARSLEKAVRSHEAERSRRVAAMRRLIAGGPQVFLTFLDSARARFDRCESVLSQHAQSLPVEAIDELFRQAHTVRGEARAFDLVELEEATDRLEKDLDELRRQARGNGRALTESATGRLRTALALARKGLENGCEVLTAASPAGAAVFDQVTVPRSVLADLVQYAAHGPEPLARLVARLSSVPLGVVAAGVGESVAAWAESECKAVDLRVEPRELLIPEPLAHALPGVLAHLVRNCIAHGIEAPAARRDAGKPEHGTIWIRAVESAAGIQVVVEDDGQGLNVARIVERAGGGKDDASAAELVFLPGVTTREEAGALAGQGVGLDAVRSELARIGYGASLTFDAGRWTRVLLAPRGAAHTE
jgi:two-component system, chemotaxis family, sensor kinase CheA